MFFHFLSPHPPTAKRYIGSSREVAIFERHRQVRYGTGRRVSAVDHCRTTYRHFLSFCQHPLSRKSRIGSSIIKVSCPCCRFQAGPIVKVVPLKAGHGAVIAVLTDPNYEVREQIVVSRSMIAGDDHHAACSRTWSRPCWTSRCPRRCCWSPTASSCWRGPTWTSGSRRRDSIPTGSRRWGKKNRLLPHWKEK